MILFKEDWDKYYNPIPDYNTTNESFLKMASKYKAMGIQNYHWHLALMQPELSGVNAHDPDLDPEIKLMISRECKFNPMYFFREVVRIPPQGEPEAVPLRANRGNMALYWSFFNNIDCFLIQPRQTGKSVSTDALSTWIIYVGARNTRMYLITKDHALRKANIDRLKTFRDELPPWMLERSAADANNSEEISYMALGNRYSTGVSQGDPKGADKLGRGLTVPVLHFDEPPYVDYIGITLPVAISSGNAARENARKNGQPSGIIYTTTAGRKDDRDGGFIYDVLMGGTIWNETYFDCKDNAELIETVKANGRDKVSPLLNITMSHRQLGLTDEWLHVAMAKAKISGEAADRDYLNIWTSGTQSSPLTPAQNEAIRLSEMEIVENEIHREGRYALRKYFDSEDFMYVHDNSHFLGGMDTSDAIGRDGIGLVVSNAYNMATVAAGTYNKTNLLQYATYVAHLLKKYQNMTLIIERKGSGQSVLDMLLMLLPKMGMDPFKRLFNRVVDEASEKRDRFEEVWRTPETHRSVEFYSKYKELFGFVTTKETRDLLYGDVLQEAARNCCDGVIDKILSNEIRGLVIKNGRLDHKAGGHDDMVISWLLNHWLAQYGRNLEHYGIPTKLLRRAVSNTGRQMRHEEVRQQEQQLSIQEEIDEVSARLKGIRDPMLQAKLEHRLKVLQSRVVVSDVEATSVDELLRSSEDSREVSMKSDAISRRRPIDSDSLRNGLRGRRTDPLRDLAVWRS